MKNIILSIEGISCSACSNCLEKFLNNQNGVKVTIENVEVVDEHKIVSIKLDDNLIFAFADENVDLEKVCYRKRKIRI